MVLSEWRFLPSLRTGLICSALPRSCSRPLYINIDRVSCCNRMTRIARQASSFSSLTCRSFRYSLRVVASTVLPILPWLDYDSTVLQRPSNLPTCSDESRCARTTDFSLDPRYPLGMAISLHSTDARQVLACGGGILASLEAFSPAAPPILASLVFILAVVTLRRHSPASLRSSAHSSARLTLDIHQRTQLNPLRIMPLPMHPCRPERQLHQRRIPYLLHFAPQPIRPDLALDAGRAGFGARRDSGRWMGDGGGEGAGRCGNSCAKEGHGGGRRWQERSGRERQGKEKKRNDSG